MGFLKGQVFTPKFTTAEISDSEDRVYYVPIKHSIGEYFLAEIDGKFFAFSMRGARKLTHRSKSGLGKSFQVIQYDTTHAYALSPTTKQLEIMLQENSLGKLNRKKLNILSILARKEKENFGMWSVGEMDFNIKKEADDYLSGLADKTITVKDLNGKDMTKTLVVIHNVHRISDLLKVFEAEEKEYPKDTKEIKAYLKSLDIKHIVSPVRPLVDFITEDLITTHPSFLGEGLAHYARLDGTLRPITNVPVKPKGNMMKYMVVAFAIVAVIGGGYALTESGALDGLFDFTDNLSTIQEGFKGLPAPGAIVRTNSAGGADYSDGAIQAQYPDCASMQVAIEAGTLNYNNLSGFMKGLVDSC